MAKSSAKTSKPKPRSKICNRCTLRPRALRSIWCRECIDEKANPKPTLVPATITIGDFAFETIVSGDLVERVERLCQRGPSWVWRAFENGIEQAELFCGMCKAAPARLGKELCSACWQSRGSQKGE